MDNELKWHTETRKVSELKAHPKNPRKISKEQMEQIKKSIQNFDYVELVAINHDGTILAGHMRTKALKELGRGKEEIEVRVPNRLLSDSESEEYLIRSNKSTGEWDFDILANNWNADDLIDFGFSKEELAFNEIEEIEPQEEDESELEEPPAEPKTKLGDLYELGPHRLICGDSTMPDVVEKVLAGAEPILMVTDPPYGVNYDASWRKDRLSIDGKKENKRFGKVENDDQNDWRLAYSFFAGNVAYIWCASLFLHKVAQQIEDAGFDLKTLLVWNKHAFSLGRGDYHWKHEPCWYAVKKGCNHNWQGSRKECSVWDIDSMQETGRKDKSEDRTEHSTQKPLECMARPIRNNSAEGEGVYDPFLGSGTTLIAADQLKRICYGIELSPAYCDVIVNRYIKFKKKNNQEASVKLNGEIYA